MARRRVLYSFLMVTIYVVASMLSSLSLIFCDHHHPHHHHHVECHAEGCSCGSEVTLSADCCDHHHPILGDNHTDYIDSSHRSDSRASHALALLLLPMVVDNISQELDSSLDDTNLEYRSISFALIDVAYISSQGLRAPPCLA